MTRPKGLTKSGGRAKGTPNKSTLLLDEKLASLNFDPVVELVKCFEHLDSGQKATAILKLFDYLFPKRKSIEIDSNPSTSFNNTFAGLVMAINNTRDDS